MTNRWLIAAALVASTAAPAFADCPVTAQETKEILAAFPAAQKAERAGRPADALSLYVQSQGFLCDGNPNAAAAAVRAAALALPLARAAEAQGQFADAFALYEQGGYYGAADAALLALLRHSPDDVTGLEQHIHHFQRRTVESFATNHANEIKAAGAYVVNDALRRELEAMPARGVERALAAEQTAFDEQYLTERLRLVQSRPEPSPANMAAVASAIEAERAFAAKWQADRVRQSQEALLRARRFAALADDRLRTATDVKVRQVAESRAATLMSRYAGAPDLLAAAADYFRSVDHLTPAAPRVAQVHAQSSTLGDQARARGRLSLAIEYYQLAGADAKAEAARAEQQQAAMRQMQPTIDDARRAAEAMAAEFADPAKVEALRKQAEAARAAVEASKAAAGTKGSSRQQETADLERELGLR